MGIALELDVGAHGLVMCASARILDAGVTRAALFGRGDASVERKRTTHIMPSHTHALKRATLRGPDHEDSSRQGYSPPPPPASLRPCGIVHELVANEDIGISADVPAAHVHIPSGVDGMRLLKLRRQVPPMLCLGQHWRAIQAIAMAGAIVAGVTSIALLYAAYCCTAGPASKPR